MAAADAHSNDAVTHVHPLLSGDYDRCSTADHVTFPTCCDGVVDPRSAEWGKTVDSEILAEPSRFCAGTNR
jgi:hypothetical protein